MAPRKPLCSQLQLLAQNCPTLSCMAQARRSEIQPRWSRSPRRFVLESIAQHAQLVERRGALGMPWPSPSSCRSSSTSLPWGNRQLRILNPLIAPSTGRLRAPTQVLHTASLSGRGGVSSFGYSGTIAHVVLGCADTQLAPIVAHVALAANSVSVGQER